MKRLFPHKSCNITQAKSLGQQKDLRTNVIALSSYRKKQQTTATSMDHSILIVEDEDDIRELIALNLEVLGHKVTRCGNGQTGFDLACSQSFSLMVLDVMLPGMDGLQVCQKLRAKSNYTPILMLTAKNTEADRVLGLEYGADDYLTKPFSVLELQARVKAMLRRMQFLSADASAAPSINDIQFDDWHIDIEKRMVTRAKQEVHFTAKEFDLLTHLAKEPGKVYSRDQLLDSVWGYQHSGYEHTVNSHINRLRAKIEDDPNNPKYVLTVWGVGYKFYEN